MHRPKYLFDAHNIPNAQSSICHTEGINAQNAPPSKTPKSIFARPPSAYISVFTVKPKLYARLTRFGPRLNTSTAGLFGVYIGFALSRWPGLGLRLKPAAGDAPRDVIGEEPMDRGSGLGFALPTREEMRSEGLLVVLPLDLVVLVLTPRSDREAGDCWVLCEGPG